MCPSTPPEPYAESEAFDPDALPPKLRRLYEASKRLAEIRAERDSWLKAVQFLDQFLAKPEPPEQW